MALADDNHIKGIWGLPFFAVIEKVQRYTDRTLDRHIRKLSKAADTHAYIWAMVSILVAERRRRAMLRQEIAEARKTI